MTAYHSRLSSPPRASRTSPCSELANGPGDALTLLRQRGRGRLDRQQTIAGDPVWSHGLLEGEEQMIFRRLAVFAGGFDLEAAASVCDRPGPVVIDLVSRLVDKSLVHTDTAESTDAIPVARGGAAVRRDAARGKPRRWLPVVSAIWSGTPGPAAAHDPDRGEVVVGEPSGWFDVEQDNLRAALATALATDPTTSPNSWLYVLLALLG